MAQQMITLEEAAEKLGISPEEMKKRLKTDSEFRRLSQIRDGATVRFKLAAIEELARALGMASEEGLPLAPLSLDEEPPGSEDFRVPGLEEKKAKAKKEDEPLEFGGGSTEEEVFALSEEPAPAQPPAPKSSGKLTPKPPPKGMSDSSVGSSDSDVRLDGGTPKKVKADESAIPTEEIALDFSGPGSAVIKGGSSAKLAAPKAGGSSGKLSASESGKVAKPDSGKVPKPDSGKVPKPDSGKVPKPDTGSGKVPKPDTGKMPKSDSAKGFKRTPTPKPADSSEFELSLDADSDDFDLRKVDAGDEVDLGSLPRSSGSGKTSSQSGINLRDPADSGISLEKGKKGKDSGKSKKAVDPDSESDVDFELSLDSSAAAASSSKLGAPKSGKLVLDSESDSEFELTLDDSGGSLEEAALGSGEESSDKGDIFETDFEIPQMPDDSSSSEAVAVESDTDLEKSDFELAMDDADVAADEPSQSEVVLLEDDEPKSKSKVKSKKRLADTAEDEVDLAGADVEAVDEEDASVSKALKGAKGRKRGVDEDEEEEEVPAGTVIERPTKPWGIVPVLFLAPALLVVLLGSIMGYEMLSTMWGYQQPRRPAAPIVRWVASTFDMDVKDQ